MKKYQVNGKSYTENEVIAIHAMWQDIQDRDNIKECLELALAMIGDDEWLTDSLERQGLQVIYW